MIRVLPVHSAGGSGTVTSVTTTGIATTTPVTTAPIAAAEPGIEQVKEEESLQDSSGSGKNWLEEVMEERDAQEEIARANRLVNRMYVFIDRRKLEK
jgi:hypothetical protein